MTDEQTQRIETSKAAEPLAPPPADAGAVPEPMTGAAATVPTAPPAAPSAWSPTADTTPAPTTAVATSRGSNRARWIVAFAVAALAIGLTVGAALFLGRSTTPEALRYVPADAAMVMEVRMDLPGDQMQKLGNLLAHFPGFADQSTLGTKLDEAFNRLVQSGSNGEADYVTDIKPWLNGPAFVGVSVDGSGSSAEPESVLLSATTNGAVSCATTFEGQAVTHETHRGLDVVLSADGEAACVVDGRQALVGDPATVRRALDVKADGGGMDRSATYAEARTALGGDRLATVYVSGAAIRDLMPTDGETVGMPMPDIQALTGAVPDWTMVGVRAEDDSLVIDTVAAAAPEPSGSTVSLLPLPATHPSVIAPLVPADTLLLVEDQGTGVSLQNLLARLESIPEVAAPLQMLDGMGGAGELVGWIDDMGIAVSMNADKPEVAVLLVGRDESAVTERLSTVNSLLGLLALSGQGTQVQRTTVAGVEVTTVTIDDVGALVPPGSVPGMEAIPATGPISFSFAARGRVLMLTSGQEAMTELVNVQQGSSLSSSQPFVLAGQRGLPNSRTTVYLAAGAAADLAVDFLPQDVAAKWAAEYAPYVDPIEAIGITTTTDPGGSRSRVVITVTGP